MVAASCTRIASITNSNQTKVSFLSSLQVRLQLPVTGEVEGELREQPELALDLHPAGAAHVAPGVKPLAHHFLVRGQGLEPQVEDLLVEAEADEAAQLHVHLGVHGAVSEVDGLDASGTVMVISQCSMVEASLFFPLLFTILQ